MSAPLFRKGEMEAVIGGVAHRLNVSMFPGLDNQMRLEQLPVIDMLLYCPRCAAQHIDDPKHYKPHASHRCRYCNTQFKPADVLTRGVADIKTRGKNDMEPKGLRVTGKEGSYADEAIAIAAIVAPAIFAFFAGSWLTFVFMTWRHTP